MPAKESFISKQEFRGDFLKDTFCAYFDQYDGNYAFDYAVVPPEIKDEFELALKKIEFRRVTSKDLSEVQKAIDDYLAGVGTPGPRAKGEITKAAEKEAEALEEVRATKESLEKKNREQGLSQVETSLLQTAQQSENELLREQKLTYARKRKNAFNDRAPLPALLPAEQAEKTTIEAVLSADEAINKIKASLEDPVTKVVRKPTDAEAAEMARQQAIIDNFQMPQEVPSVEETISKVQYDDARAIVTSLENKEDITPDERVKLDKALLQVKQYESANPEVSLAAAKKETSMQYALEDKKYQEAKEKLEKHRSGATPLPANEVTALETILRDYESPANPRQLEKRIRTLRGSPINTGIETETLNVSNIFGEGEKGIPTPYEERQYRTALTNAANPDKQKIIKNFETQYPSKAANIKKTTGGKRSTRKHKSKSKSKHTTPKRKH